MFDSIEAFDETGAPIQWARGMTMEEQVECCYANGWSFIDLS